jgi:hypothetical protein
LSTPRGLNEAAPGVHPAWARPQFVLVDYVLHKNRTCAEWSDHDLLFRQYQHPKDYGDNNRDHNDCGADYPGASGSLFYAVQQSAHSCSCSTSDLVLKQSNEMLDWRPGTSAGHAAHSLAGQRASAEAIIARNAAAWMGAALSRCSSRQAAQS